MFLDSKLFRFLWVFVVLLAACTGCGSDSPTNSGSTSGPTAQDGILDLQNMLKELSAANQPIPKGIADLAPIEPVYPTAGVFLQNGSIVYYWGNGINASAPNASTTVIAHDAQAESKGGWVLLQDGTAKQMTADEFKATTKPQGKSGAT